jgi:hypothetical protein
VKIKHVLGRVMVIAAAATGLAALGLTGVASASTGQVATPRTLGVRDSLRCCGFGVLFVSLIPFSWWR